MRITNIQLVHNRNLCNNLKVRKKQIRASILRLSQPVIDRCSESVPPDGTPLKRNSLQTSVLLAALPVSLLPLLVTPDSHAGTSFPSLTSNFSRFSFAFL